MKQPRTISPDDIVVDYFAGGGGASQIRMIGNSVCPPMSEALFRANLPELCDQPERMAA